MNKKTIPILNLYKKLIQKMEGSGSSYLKKQSVQLDRYVTQIETSEITFAEFHVLTVDIIVVKQIDQREDYHSKAKIRECIEDAKQLFRNIR